VTLVGLHVARLPFALHVTEYRLLPPGPLGHRRFERLGQSVVRIPLLRSDHGPGCSHALSPAEAADRLAIRELFDAYAHCADRRDAEGQKALFTVDTRFAVYMTGEKSEPTYVRGDGTR